MSPLSAPEPCPHIVQRGTFVFCGSYERRPEECKRHDFSASVCPIGVEMLNITSLDELRKRIDDGYAMTTSGLEGMKSEQG